METHTISTDEVKGLAEALDKRPLKRAREEEDEEENIDKTTKKGRIVVEIEDLHCPVCRDVYFEPMTMDCGHTICKVCLFQLPSSPGTCPVCRKSLATEHNKLPVNVVLKNLVSRFPEEEETRRRHLVQDNSCYAESVLSLVRERKFTDSQMLFVGLCELYDNKNAAKPTMPKPSRGLFTYHMEMMVRRKDVGISATFGAPHLFYATPKDKAEAVKLLQSYANLVDNCSYESIRNRHDYNMRALTMEVLNLCVGGTLRKTLMPSLDKAFKNLVRNKAHVRPFVEEHTLMLPGVEESVVGFQEGVDSDSD